MVEEVARVLDPGVMGLPDTHAKAVALKRQVRERAREVIAVVQRHTSVMWQDPLAKV
jgi:hypothetical protein